MRLLLLLRNGVFVSIVLGAMMHPTDLRAVDRGCQGEDSYGQTNSYGAYYCSGSNDCCESAGIPQDFSDTVQAFCEDYGGPNWDESYWDAEVWSSSMCAGVVIHCACDPLPRN